jgi:hypothetical protein
MQIEEVFVGQSVKVIKAQAVAIVIEVDRVNNQVKVAGYSVEGWFWAHELEPIITFR